MSLLNLGEVWPTPWANLSVAERPGASWKPAQGRPSAARWATQDDVYESLFDQRRQEVEKPRLAQVPIWRRKQVHAAENKLKVVWLSHISEVGLNVAWTRNPCKEVKNDEDSSRPIACLPATLCKLQGCHRSVTLASLCIKRRRSWLGLLALLACLMSVKPRCITKQGIVVFGSILRAVLAHLAELVLQREIRSAWARVRQGTRRHQRSSNGVQIDAHEYVH